MKPLIMTSPSEPDRQWNSVVVARKYNQQASASGSQWNSARAAKIDGNIDTRIRPDGCPQRSEIGVEVNRRQIV